MRGTAGWRSDGNFEESRSGAGSGNAPLSKNQ